MPRILCIFDTGYAFQVQIIMISLEGDRRQKGLFAMYVSVALNWEGRFFYAEGYIIVSIQCHILSSHFLTSLQIPIPISPCSFPLPQHHLSSSDPSSTLTPFPIPLISLRLLTSQLYVRAIINKIGEGIRVGGFNTDINFHSRDLFS